MKAAVINAPNAEVRIEERGRPSPGRGEVLIRVHACGVCHGDLMRTWEGGADIILATPQQPNR